MTDDKPFFENAVVIGVGLIGGSIARVLKNRQLARKIIGCGRSRENLDVALKLGIIDEIAAPEEAVKNADVIFLCAPSLSILPTLEKIAPHIKGSALVTDVGSTKKEIAEGAEKIARGKFVFIGSHPIAGTEKSGAAASFENLFDGRKCIVTPLPETPPDALKKLKAFWSAAGMETVIMDTDTHDRILGAVSHLPHMAAFALVDTAIDEIGEEALLRYAGGSFGDMTRVTSSPPEIWADIAIGNSETLIHLIGKIKEKLGFIESAINANDKERLTKIFKKSQELRRKLS